MHCTINNNMIGKLYDFAVFFEDMGVDTLYLCYPWYIPDSVCEKMDTYFESRWPDKSREHPKQNRSWRGFSFCVDTDLIKIWTNKEFSKMRKIIASGLMPVCSKCILLYLNGV